MNEEIFDKKDAGKKLRKILLETKGRLNNISNEEAQSKKSPGKWSNKEVIGHLIDSAVINIQRFMRTSFQDDLIFSGYDQDEWVKLQNYNSIDWEELVNLWYCLNQHLSRVMDSVPDKIMFKEFQIHNLNEIAFKTVTKEKSVTLEYFMNDYIEHLKHHLTMINVIE